jgi:hypothetical protein
MSRIAIAGMACRYPDATSRPELWENALAVRFTDLTHWLALDVAAQTLADTMRVRRPYVRRLVAAALKKQDWDDDQLAAFLDDFETRYKTPFPAVDEDTLAGLSNTIAERICNRFDLKGGGYSVAGACSSSLLSVVPAGLTLVLVRSAFAGSPWIVFAAGNLRFASLVTNVWKSGERDRDTASPPGWCRGAADRATFTVLSDGWL